MAFTTMHFAVGMAGAGVATGIAALCLRRGMRWVPVWMTVGGVWACAPDMPRIFKEDFPNAPFASTLSAKPLQDWLNANGDLFFLHRMLDSQPKEYALHGLLGILAMYSVSVFLLALMQSTPHKPRLNRSATKDRKASHPTL
ncbi:MAG: hypothetical protein ACPGYV_12775 [Phycisphaeraceae bacterium]